MPIHDWTRVPEMPLFLTNYLHIMVPLEATYQATWEVSPKIMKEAIETGVMPEPDAE